MRQRWHSQVGKVTRSSVVSQVSARRLDPQNVMRPLADLSGSVMRIPHQEGSNAPFHIGVGVCRTARSGQGARWFLRGDANPRQRGPLCKLSGERKGADRNAVRPGRNVNISYKRRALPCTISTTEVCMQFDIGARADNSCKVGRGGRVLNARKRAEASRESPELSNLCGK